MRTNILINNLENIKYHASVFSTEKNNYSLLNKSIQSYLLNDFGTTSCNVKTDSLGKC